MIEHLPCAHLQGMVQALHQLISAGPALLQEQTNATFQLQSLALNLTELDPS
jgi:hypothetical protein